MKIVVKMTGALHGRIIEDLKRPHPFAYERVGFVLGRSGKLEADGRIILINQYYSIPDEHYIPDETVGARIGREAMTWAMQTVYSGRSSKLGIYHIHHHPFPGRPRLSPTDRAGLPRMIPGFQNVSSEAIHGLIILTDDHGAAWLWPPHSDQFVEADQVSVIGYPIAVFPGASA